MSTVCASASLAQERHAFRSPRKTAWYKAADGLFHYVWDHLMSFESKFPCGVNYSHGTTSRVNKTSVVEDRDLRKGKEECRMMRFYIDFIFLWLISLIGSGDSWILPSPLRWASEYFLLWLINRFGENKSRRVMKRGLQKGKYYFNWDLFYFFKFAYFITELPIFLNHE